MAQTKYTLAEAVRDTVRGRWLHSRSQVTSKGNAMTAVSFFGAACAVADISPARLRAYVSYLQRRGLSPSTINRKLSALATVLTEACEAGHIDTVPTIRRQREAPAKTRWLTEEEEGNLLRASDGTPLQYLYAFLIDTGLRIGEALALRPNDVTVTEVGRGTAHVHDGKGGKQRSIPLSLRALHSFDISHVFWQGWDYDFVRNRFDEHVALAGLEDVTLHTLRHTCASRLAQRGVSLPIIKQWMGHSSIQTTMRYAHLSTESLNVALEAIEQ